MDISYKNVKNKAYQTLVEKTLAKIQATDADFSINTSGSTGVPKNITIKKEHMFASADATNNFLNLSSGAKALLCLPADKIAGAMMLTRAIVGGWRLIVVEPRAEPLKDLAAENFDFAAMVPLQVKHSLQALNRVEKLIVGGGAVEDDLVRQLRPLKTACWHTFGMTETISHVALRMLSPQTELAFKALPGVSFETDEKQRLIIHAPHIGIEGLLTNDLVKLRSSQAFEWLGRLDNVVNSAGVKLFPESLEQKINLPYNFFLTGLPHPDLGEQLVMLVENGVPLNEDTLKKSLRALGRYEKPKQIFYLPKFIYTGNGKLQRKATLKLLNNAAT